MDLNVNTYILKGFDSDQTSLLSYTLEYISSAKKINNTVNVIDNLDLQLQKNDFLVIVIDELLLDKITQNSTNVHFFDQKQFQQNQIILVLDDIDIKSLPLFLHECQIFTTSTSSTKSIESWDDTDTNKINLTEIVDDIVYYINKVSLGVKKDKLTIYLGPTDDNTLIEYQKITRELLHRDYNVLPEVSNFNEKGLVNNEDNILKMISLSDLTIHFIGHKSILDYPNKNSLAIKINSIAVGFCKQPDGEKLQRIIYVPSEKGILDELLDQKIQQFKGDTNLLLNAELIQTSVEKFKEVILRKLEYISVETKDKSTAQDNNKFVYFIYPPGEDDGAKPYIEWFNKNNINYRISQVDLDQLALINYHKHQLITCNSVMVYNSGNREWLSRKLSDIKKSPGWGRKRPFNTKIICELQPNDKLLETEKHNSYITVDNYKLNKDLLEKLLTD